MWRNGIRIQSAFITNRILFCGPKNWGHVLKHYTLFCLKIIVKYVGIFICHIIFTSLDILPLLWQVSPPNKHIKNLSIQLLGPVVVSILQEAMNGCPSPVSEITQGLLLKDAAYGAAAYVYYELSNYLSFKDWCVFPLLPAYILVFFPCIIQFCIWLMFFAWMLCLDKFLAWMLTPSNDKLCGNLCIRCHVTAIMFQPYLNCS